MFDTLTQKHAVGQIRKRVMFRHMRNLHFDALDLRHVVMRGEPAAVGHWPMHDRDMAPACEFLNFGRWRALDNRGEPFLNICFRFIASVDATGYTMLYNFSEISSWLR